MASSLNYDIPFIVMTHLRNENCKYEKIMIIKEEPSLQFLFYSSGNMEYFVPAAF